MPEKENGEVLNPHDKFILSEGSKQEWLRGDLLHYSYNSVIVSMWHRINTFSTIMAQSLYNMGRRSSIHKIVLHPLWRFIKDFLVKAGFLDGYYGFIISVNSLMMLYS